MGVRIAEVMAALSLTTDLATGLPFEKGLRVCIVADELVKRLPDRVTDDGRLRATTYQATLLRSIGCTSRAPENAAEFVDDVAFQCAVKHLDLDADHLAEQLTGFGDWQGSPESQQSLADRFVDLVTTDGPHAARYSCEVSRALAPPMGACADAVAALDDVYERWDGHGLPDGRSAHRLSFAGRIMHVAEQAVLAHVAGGTDHAIAEVRRRGGGHLDPDVARIFVDDAPSILASTAETDLLAAVLEREPAPQSTVDGAGFTSLCGVLGMVADLKSVYLTGHSSRVARVAAAAARRVGLTDVQIGDLEAAGHLHGLGCVVVPSSLLDRPQPSGQLGTADRERLRLQSYWTSRILERCPSLRTLEPLTRPAGALHAAFAEAGWGTWRGSTDASGPFAARILEAAEVWCTLTEDRPGRPALPPAAARSHLCAAVDDGRLESDAVWAVLSAVDVAPVSQAAPNGLTARELEVLRHAAKGMSNREIAVALVISERTVGHHLAHVFDKTGYRTRAGVAVWAVQRGLIPAEPGDLERALS